MLYYKRISLDWIMHYVSIVSLQLCTCDCVIRELEMEMFLGSLWSRNLCPVIYHWQGHGVTHL